MKESPLNTLQRLQNTASNVLACHWQDITPEKNFITDLGATSLDMVAIVNETEYEFGILIDEDDARKVRTVAELVALVERMQPET